MNYHRLLNEFWRTEGHKPENKSLCAQWNEVEDSLATNFETMNEMAKSYLDTIKLRKMRQAEAQLGLADYLGSFGDKVYMVTINYPNKFTSFQWMQEIVNTITEKDWIKRFAWVHEYHTSTGTHPHTHLILTCHKKFTPRRLAETIYAVKQIKKYCEGLNFIQVEKDMYRTWIDRLDYIIGNKREEKSELLELDRLWREKYKIMEYVPK